MTVYKDMLTDLMSERKTCCEKINRFLSEKKVIQPHKGVWLSAVRRCIQDDGTFKYIAFIRMPQWVVTPENPYYKLLWYRCTEQGEFIEWLRD